MSIISMILFLHPGYPGEMRFSGNTSPLSHRDSTVSEAHYEAHV